MNNIISTNPSREFAVIWEVPVTTEEEITKIVKKARQAQKNWSNLSVWERISYLSKSYDLIVTKTPLLANILSEEMGMPITQAQWEIVNGLAYFRWNLENAETFLAPEIVKETDTELHTNYYEAKWVVVAIAPWNFPFSLFIWSSIQALIAGNTVVFKTSKETILTGKMIEEIMRESGLPDWVFQEIYGSGEVGDILTSQDIDFISFTWSTQVGRKLYKKAAEKMITCTMELGWSAPGIICEDCIVDGIIDSVYIMKFLNAGQVCDGLKRLIVHESRYEEVIQKLIQVLQTKKVGDASENDTDIGPLVSQAQLDTLQSQYEEAIAKWAKILFKTELNPDLKGAYFPAVFLGSITSDMRVWQEEVFGPILPVVMFKTLEEAVSLANDTEYWLGAYVFTQNKETFRYLAREIKSAMIEHNNLNYCQPQNFFGGYKMSWIGRENGKWGFHEVCNVKVVSEEK
jgi:succinate-semialdehyde dehydrogenase / glutarate-semialdehyde dehydrogenase